MCVSDLCIAGLNHLFENKYLSKEDIDCLILVTQSPDHFIPPTSNIVQGKLGLKEDMICLDINQGCAGFIIGLIQAFMMLDLDDVKKVVLINADVLSKKVSSKDRNSNPLVGDGASITIVERDNNNSVVYGNIKMDGKGAEALMIPAGGFKMPVNEGTGVMIEDESGNLRSAENLVMKGDEVFNFVQTKVPVMIEDLLKFADKIDQNVDYYMFHQPNKFMLQKLADKMAVNHDKMPSNVVENYGNSSGVTIPAAICHNLSEQLTTGSLNLCLAGFGVGLTWTSLLIEVGNFNFCEIIEI
jgi:3-oxoacyl-[acyl-carrier-protein] synthase-3